MQEVLCLAQGKVFCWVIAADYPQLWSGDYMGYLFTPKEMKLFPFNCPDYWPPLLHSSIHVICSLLLQWVSRLWPQQIGRKKKILWSKEIKKLCITWSIAEESCFPLCLHNWLSFYAEVLMQLAIPLLNVCQIMLEFQRVKETLSCFNFSGPVLNLADFI